MAVKTILTAAAGAAAMAAIMMLVNATSQTVAAIQARQAEQAERNAASLALCEQAGGRWATKANGAPVCQTESAIRTTAKNEAECEQAGGEIRHRGGLQVCDEKK